MIIITEYNNIGGTGLIIPIDDDFTFDAIDDEDVIAAFTLFLEITLHSNIVLRIDEFINDTNGFAIINIFIVFID